MREFCISFFFFFFSSHSMSSCSTGMIFHEHLIIRSKGSSTGRSMDHFSLSS